ncbi:MAG: nucleoside deaminase [Bacteroidetes bacterium]|nr:nucleoside deaminase [Bacteroidota bacterium]MBS1630122.1 nucleoside deaminase [Bacteroidota bacterium]
MRQPEDERYMHLALQQAKEAFDADEVPIGALVVWNGKIIGRGRNEVERLKDSTAHAEMLALTAAFNTVGAKYLPEACLYVTVEPCLMCSGALFWSKIGRIVYGAEDVKHGYRHFTGDVFPFHPKAQIQSGILAEECSALMRAFFAGKRK